MWRSLPWGRGANDLPRLTAIREAVGGRYTLSCLDGVWYGASGVVDMPVNPWALQATWYIDPTLGNDLTGSGLDASHPIRTSVEFNRRFGSDVYAPTDLYITGDLPDAERFNLDLCMHTSGSFYVHGTRTQIASGTLSARTLRAPATNTPNDITDAGQTWAPLVGKLIEFTATGAVAWILKDLGGNKARISVPMTYGTVRASSTEVTLAGNEAYKVYSLTQVTSDGGIQITGGGPNILQNPQFPYVYVDYLDFRSVLSGGYPINLPTIKSDNIWTYLRCCSLYGNIEDFLCLMNCSIAQSTTVVGFRRFIYISGGAAFAWITLVGGPHAGPYTYRVPFTVQGGNITADCNVTLGTDLAIFDAPSAQPALAIGPNSNVYSYSYLYGSGGTNCGVNFYPRSSMISAASNLVISGTAGEFKFYGSAPTPQMPDLTAYASGALPPTSPITTWAQLAAAPFNGYLYHSKYGIRIAPI